MFSFPLLDHVLYFRDYPNTIMLYIHLQQIHISSQILSMSFPGLLRELRRYKGGYKSLHCFQCFWSCPSFSSDCYKVLNVEHVYWAWYVSFKNVRTVEAERERLNCQMLHHVIASIFCVGAGHYQALQDIILIMYSSSKSDKVYMYYLQNKYRY